MSVVDTFQNLCWLIVLIHMCNDVELDKDHIYNVFHVVFPMMPQLTQLHIFQESGLDTATLTLEPLLIEHLPKLLNLEYRIFNGFICHYEDQIIHTSATNLALQRLADYQTIIQKLSQAYPTLKHWSLGRINRKVNADIYDKGKVTMPTIQSVVMTCQGCCLEHSSYFDDIQK